MRPSAHRAVTAITCIALLLACVPFASADEGTHSVQPGETLFRIALNHGVTVDALKAANGIRGTTIYVGQTLVIPGQAAAANVSAPANTTVSAIPANGAHQVQRGENLFRIALKYGVSVAALQQVNNLRGTTIYSGQWLTIPGAAASAPAPEPTPQPQAESPTAAPQPATPTELPAVQPASSGGGKRFVIDLSEQRLYAYEGDTMVRTTLVSTGVARYPTVTGTFYIYLRYTSQRMIGPGYDLPGVPYVQYFYKSYGLHGTYWHNNFGTPMSHGCVNMPTSEAEWAFNWATIGTPVIVQQ